FVVSVGCDVDSLRRKYPVVCEIPFNSFNKYYLTVHGLEKVSHTSLQHKYLVCIKGAPERILNFCCTILLNGQPREFDDAARNTMANIFEYLASMGERVLAFAEMYANDLDTVFEDAGRTK